MNTLTSAKEDEYREVIRSLTLKVHRMETLIQELRIEPYHRPASHIHDPDHPRPVLVFDFNQTITPWRGYPVEGDGSDPYPGVVKWLNRWSAQGACLHLATAGLWPQIKSDPLVYSARWAQLDSYMKCYGIPIDFFLPKADSDIFYDDRMIAVPPDPAKVDWNQIGQQAEQALSKRFTLKGGMWERKPKQRVGHEITDDEWPIYDEVVKDNPRGYSTSVIDVDFHRTLSLASSSLRTAGFKPGAVDGVNTLYNHGFTVYLSCAGWNPAIHTLEDSERRIAMMRQTAKVGGVLYDQFVTKDHGDLYFDDKGFTHTTWEADLPQLISILEDIGARDASHDGQGEIDRQRLDGVADGQEAGFQT